MSRATAAESLASLYRQGGVGPASDRRAELDADLDAHLGVLCLRDVLFI